MKILALTGGIASGKSTVARMFEKRGAVVLDADRLAHRVYRRGTSVYRILRRRYGRKILRPGGAIDRKKLGDILFHSAKEKRWLDKQIHPAVFELLGEKIRAALTKKPPLILVEAALHVETGYHRHFPGLIVVWAHPQRQRERLVGREGLSAAQVRARLKSQMPAAKKLKWADYVVDNSKSLKNTERQVKRLFKKLTEDKD